ncbi:acetyl-CoA C-acyltransferase [Kineococcus sp. LSe6-4]|uniref:Probable acetyl-CoA acetyltransferase n=1 Tax=Kineococcus halophytocola TaxID=3234027 RepID=A0ABV4GV66_9ACTN
MSAVVVAARRTPFATAGTTFAGLRDHDLAAAVLAALADDVTACAAGEDVTVAEVVAGVGTADGNPARRAALAAGLGAHVPGTTVDAQCASGLAAVRFAAALAATGTGPVLAVGAESTTARHRDGVVPRAAFAPDDWPDPDMGPAADTLATHLGITRADQEAFAVRSHARALAARRRTAQRFVPLAGVEHDARPRVLRPEVVARFPPAFGGTVTAATASAHADGAAGLALLDAATADRWGAGGLAVLGTAAVGADPALPGAAAAPAVREALRAAHLDVADVDRFEVGEAFAAQVLACSRDLGLADEDPRLNPDGGALAVGHPWGATGAALLVALAGGLAPGRVGVAVSAAGGGLGVAVVVRARSASAGA